MFARLAGTSDTWTGVHRLTANYVGQFAWSIGDTFATSAQCSDTEIWPPGLRSKPVLPLAEAADVRWAAELQLLVV